MKMSFHFLNVEEKNIHVMDNLQLPLDSMGNDEIMSDDVLVDFSPIITDLSKP